MNISKTDNLNNNSRQRLTNNNICDANHNADSRYDIAVPIRGL